MYFVYNGRVADSLIAETAAAVAVGDDAASDDNTDANSVAAVADDANSVAGGATNDNVVDIVVLLMQHVPFLFHLHHD